MPSSVNELHLFRTALMTRISHSVELLLYVCLISSPTRSYISWGQILKQFSLQGRALSLKCIRHSTNGGSQERGWKGGRGRVKKKGRKSSIHTSTSHMQILEILPWKIMPLVTESGLSKSGSIPGAKQKKKKPETPALVNCGHLLSYTVLRAPAAPKSLPPPSGAFPLNPKGTLEPEGLRMAQMQAWLKGHQYIVIQSIDYTWGLKPIPGQSQNRC